jgi:hypothetical protein
MLSASPTVAKITPSQPEERPVSERQYEQTDRPDSVKRKAEWTRPEVDRLLAGGAEATDGADTDGVTLS